MVDKQQIGDVGFVWEPSDFIDFAFSSYSAVYNNCPLVKVWQSLYRPLQE